MILACLYSRHSVIPTQRESCLMVLLEGKCEVYKSVSNLFTWSEVQESLISDMQSQNLAISGLYFLSLPTIPYESQHNRILFSCPTLLHFKPKKSCCLHFYSILSFLQHARNTRYQSNCFSGSDLVVLFPAPVLRTCRVGRK